MSVQLPWVSVGGKRCCCGLACNVIANSLCLDGSGEAVCGFPEFTAAASGEQELVEASCPPKFYRTKTSIFTGHWDISVTAPEGTQGYDFEFTIIEKYLADCTIEKTCSGTSSSFSHFPGDIIDCSGTFICSDYEWYGGGYVDYTCTGRYGFPPVESWYSAGISTGASTIVESTILASGSGIWNPLGFANPPGASGSWSLSTTLSDEVTLHDTLKSKVCEADYSCDPAIDEGCDPCCTCDEVANPDCTHSIPGRKFLAETPAGCITPGSGWMAWDSSACDTSGHRSGQGVELSFWFKNLVPGVEYQSVVTFGRSEFAKVDGEYPVPDCSSTLACTEDAPTYFPYGGPSFTPTEGEWAVIFSGNCSLCEILALECALNDEADRLDISDPLPSPRTVLCLSGGVSIPTIANHYTWFDSCKTLVVPPL